jgi:chromosome segregation ATPase
MKAAAEEMAVVRNQIADRDLRIQALEGSLREATLRVDNALAQLSERSEELAKASLQLKDARLELDVAESGSTVTSAQISQLQRERDELAALVEQLRPRRQVSRPFA